MRQRRSRVKRCNLEKIVAAWMIGLMLGLGMWDAAVVRGQPTNPSGEQKDRGGVRARKPVRPAVFDAGKDPQEALKEAICVARLRQRRVLMIFGSEANRAETDALAQMLAFPSQASLMQAEYAVVKVEVGTDAGRSEESANIKAGRELARRLGVSLEQPKIEAVGDELQPGQHGVWAVVGSDGKLIAQQHLASTAKLFQGRLMYDAMKTIMFLDANKQKLPDGEGVFKAAMAKAGSGKRRLLTLFVEGGDLWGERLTDWLESEAVKRVVGAKMDVVVLDTSRNFGSDKVMERLGGKGVENLPWFAILEGGEGERVLSRSHGPGRANIGVPTNDEEMAYFGKMLEDAGLSGGEIEELKRLLREEVKGWASK